jgi:hypothetical protein
MQSWVEKTGGGRTEPRGDAAAPADGQTVAADDQAAPADAEPVAAGDQPVAADHQAVAAHDQPVSAGGEPVAAGDQAAPAGGEPVAASDQPMAADDRVVIVTEDDQDATAAAGDEGDTAGGGAEPDLAAFVPAGAAAAGESRSALAGGHAGDAAAGEAGIGARLAPDASQPPADEATPNITAASSPEPGPAQGADSVSAAGRWTEIQAMFVDDPRASVELAADLVDDSLEAFVASARQRQGSLRSTWGGSDADTEQLRKALQRYRAFWRQLHSISIEP